MAQSVIKKAVMIKFLRFIRPRLRLGTLSRLHLLALPSLAHVCALSGQKTTKYSVAVLRRGAGRRLTYYVKTKLSYLNCTIMRLNCQIKSCKMRRIMVQLR